MVMLFSKNQTSKELVIKNPFSKLTREERISMIEESKAKRQEALISFRDSLNARVLKFFDDLPVSIRWAWYLNFTGRKSSFFAIKLKCLDCCCWERIEVKNCTLETCPLHRHRPYQDKDKE